VASNYHSHHPALSEILLKLFNLIPGTAFSFNISINDLIGMQPLIQLMLASGIIFTGLGCAAYFAITNYILSKRLNLE